MNGCLLKEVPIAVDLWTLPQLKNANLLFFLSHLHADHTKGLTSSWRFPIYTSPINYKLANAKFEFPQNVLKVLNLDVMHELPLKNGSFINVTLINANHIPGSVMFLFQGTFGNILYTGDMRYYTELKCHPMLESILANSAIDVLYLDNTFCHPKFSFPTRKEVTKELLQLISKYEHHYIKIGIRKIGKESALEAISHYTSELIMVYPLRHTQMCLLNRQHTYTTDPDESRIHAIDLNRITKQSIDKANVTAPTIGIMLTAMYYNYDGMCANRQSDDIFVLPYSDHSSYPELIQLVKELQPCKVKPIVKNSNQKGCFKFPPNTDMSVFDQYLSPTRMSPGKRGCDHGKSPLSPSNTSETYSDRCAHYKSPTDGNQILDSESPQIYEDAVEEIPIADEGNIDNVFSADGIYGGHNNASGERNITNSNDAAYEGHTSNNGECITTGDNNSNTVKDYPNREEFNFSQSAPTCVGQHFERSRSSISIGNSNLEPPSKIFGNDSSTLDVESRIDVIKEINGICSKLLESDFELKSPQKQKRERFLHLMSQLCK